LNLTTDPSTNICTNSNNPPSSERRVINNPSNKVNNYLLNPSALNNDSVNTSCNSA
jgi:hypothetical protein